MAAVGFAELGNMTAPGPFCAFPLSVGQLFSLFQCDPPNESGAPSESGAEGQNTSKQATSGFRF